MKSLKVICKLHNYEFSNVHQVNIQYNVVCFLRVYNNLQSFDNLKKTEI